MKNEDTKVMDHLVGKIEEHQMNEMTFNEQFYNFKKYGNFYIGRGRE